MHLIGVVLAVMYAYGHSVKVCSVVYEFVWPEVSRLG